MSKENNNPLLKVKITKKRAFLLDIYNYLSELLYSLFDLILDNPIENFWVEFANVLIGYFQLIAYLFESAVSFSQFKIIKL